VSVGRNALMRAKPFGLRLAFFQAACCPDLEAACPAELDESSRHASCRALDQHCLASSKSRLGKERAVGGQPSRAEDREVKGRKVLGKSDRVSPRHDDVVSERAVDKFAGDVPSWVERLVTAPILAPHHRVNYNWGAVVQGAGGVVAEDDGIVDGLVMSTH